MSLLARAVCCTLAAGLVACAPARPSLPAGPGAPFSNFESAYDEAVRECRDARTVVAELGLSGRAGGSRVRGRVIAGLEAPSSIRLDAVAFGQSIFVLAGQGGTATLVLPRDGRVVTDAPADAIVEAIAGVALTPAELRSAIAGCGFGVETPSNGRSFSQDWGAVDVAGTLTYLRRVENRWRVAAAVRAPVTLLYDKFEANAPSRLFIRASAAGASDLAADLALSVSDLEINTTIDPRAFSVVVPPDAAPLSLDELRRAGPLGDRR